MLGLQGTLLIFQLGVLNMADLLIGPVGSTVAKFLILCFAGSQF